MRLALISDIHSNIEALRATLDAIAAESVDRVVCMGDIVGYNTNFAECAALLREIDALCVAGNHDRAATGQLATDKFGYTAARAIAWTRARLDTDVREFLARLPSKLAIDDQLVVVHGALHPDIGCEVVRLDSDERRRLSFAALATHPSGARICAYGHTHKVGVHELRDGEIRLLAGDEIPLREDAYYLVNPGTIGEPRGDDHRATFAILDTTRRHLTVRRVAYDTAATRRKTRKAGIAPPLSTFPALKTLVWRGLETFGLLGTVQKILRHLR